MSDTPPVASGHPRDPRLDTAKGILIALVVFGHLLEAVDYWHSGAARLPLTAIYLFHMPAFVFMAGVTASPVRTARRIGTMLVLLGVFQVVFFLVLAQVESGKSFSWGQPFWVLWFLLAMVWWQALAPLIVRAPRTAFAASLVVALGCGALPFVGYALALSRTLVFLPFFVAGMLWGGALVERAARVSPALRSLMLAACAATVLATYLLGTAPGWLYASIGFEALGVGVGEGVLMRTALLGAAALGTFTLLSFLPAHPAGRLTVMGRRSLGIYLLHGPLLLAVTPALAGVVTENGAVAAWVLCLMAGIGLLTMLSTPGPDRWLRTGAGAVVEAGAALPKRVAGQEHEHGHEHEHERGQARER